jgi:hypothetical protein
MRYAVLIDGGLVKRKLGSPAESTTISDVTRFLDHLKAHPAGRDARARRLDTGDR